MQLAVKTDPIQADLMTDRRDPLQHPDRALGRVIFCDGSRATIAGSVSGSGWLGPDTWTIGKMISVNLGSTRVVGLVYEIRSVATHWAEDGENAILAQVELLGEVSDREGEASRFRSGVSTYPPIGAIAHRIRSGDLALVHDLGMRAGVAIGSLTQDATVPATISIEGMLSRHFAILGTTGVGKSSAVSLLLRRSIAVRPRLRVLILDPHNEYAHAFPDKAVTIDGDTLDLPFWMFRLDEFGDVVFRGRPAMDEEV